MQVWLRALTISTVFALSTAGIATAESPQQAFVKKWQGKTVFVRRALYTLVYNERRLLGTTHEGKRDGLTVVTPDQGAYLQFDGRQGRHDVVENDPQRMFDEVIVTYDADGVDVRGYRKVEPERVIRYEAGFELVVDQVRLRDSVVTLSFALKSGPDASDEPATSLRIKWPLPFSKSFAEWGAVEELIHQYVDFQ